MREPYHPAAAELSLLAVLHALSDPTRLAIVAALADGGERSCAEFGLQMTKPTWSHHFRVLREAGVTRTRPVGKQRFMTLRRAELDERFPGLLHAVLGAVQPDVSADEAPARLPLPGPHGPDATTVRLAR